MAFTQEELDQIKAETPADMEEAWLRINTRFRDWWEWSQKVNKRLKIYEDTVTLLYTELQNAGNPPNGDPPKNPPLG